MSRGVTSVAARHGSVFPGDTMVVNGKVVDISTDDSGCVWVDLYVTVSVDEEVSTSCQARVAVPADDSDNPWQRKAEQWLP